MDYLRAEWISKGRKAQHPSNPKYPNGIDVNLAPSRPFCSIKLDYPAPAVGMWAITCVRCGETAMVTAAGRPDDPRSVKLPCKIEKAPP